MALQSGRAWRLAASSALAWLRASGTNTEAHAVRRLSHLTSLADFGSGRSIATVSDQCHGDDSHRQGSTFAAHWTQSRFIQKQAQSAGWGDVGTDDEESDGDDGDEGLTDAERHAKALARDPRRAAVEAALLAKLWPRRGFTAAEKPRLMQLLASPEYQGLVQATGGDQRMLDMLVETTASMPAADRWRWKNADLKQCAAVVEDQWRALLEQEGTIEQLIQEAGGEAALEQRLLAQLAARDLPEMRKPNIRPPFGDNQTAASAAAGQAATSEQRLGQRLWRQQPSAPQLPDAHAVDAEAAAREPQQPPPALLPPFVLSWAAARLCPARITPDGKPLPPPPQTLPKGEGQDSSAEGSSMQQSAKTGSVLDGWHLLMPQRWSEMHEAPSIIEAVAATERLRTEALLEEAARRASAAEMANAAGAAGAAEAADEENAALGAAQTQTVVTTIRQLYPGAVGPQHLLGKKVEVQRLRLARDWQPMLRPTRHREGFFFNPDAGRNAPTLPPEWGRGPTMAAVDPLVAFDPDAALLQAPLLQPGFISMCKGMDKEPALRRARATIRVARRWMPKPQADGSAGAPGSGRPVLFYITTQAGRDIRTQGKIRQSIKQFYKRGRFVVSGLLKKHDFDTVFVYITSHYLSTLDNFVLDQIPGKDLIVVQNYPRPVVRPPQKPAPPWSTTPHDFHGRAHRMAPAVQGEELLAGIEAYQPLFRDAPELLRMWETSRRRFRDRAHFDLY